MSSQNKHSLIPQSQLSMFSDPHKSAIRAALPNPAASTLDFLRPHLPPKNPKSKPNLHQDPTSSNPAFSPIPLSSQIYPFTTLTYATSLDSQLSLSPGIQTSLSGPLTKCLTHYLRSVHDGILIGVGTAIADNPSLNCRIEGVDGYGGDEGSGGQPRPVILDPGLRWDFECEEGDDGKQEGDERKVFKLVREGKGKTPWIITALPRERIPEGKRKYLESRGGRFITIQPGSTTKTEGEGSSKTLDWKLILSTLRQEGLNSIMVEGGGNVINTLLQPEYGEVVSSVIITIAPVYLGRGGVVVSPDRSDGVEAGRENERPVARFKDVSWLPLGEDVVMCGRI